MGTKAIKKVVDAKKSLSERLSHAFPAAGGKRPARSARIYRADVVIDMDQDQHGMAWHGALTLRSDDVIKYIAPTLEPYKGCTIVDINPGSCLWSDKLHQFLKPKRHILMEPDEEYIEPFVRPLLNKRGSTYVHTNLSGVNSRDYIQNWNDIFTSGSFIGRNRLAQNDPNLRRVDTSLLITGSLVRRNDLFWGAKGSQLSLSNVTWLSLQNRIFHQAGLVRMLWWVAELDKIAFLPHLSNYKHFASASLGLSCTTDEVVAIKSSRSYKADSSALGMRSRYSGIAAESSARVQERMADRGINVPEGRELHQLEQIKKHATNQWRSPLAVEYQTLPEFEAEFCKLHEAVEKYIAIKCGRRITVSHRPALQSLVDSIKYPQVYGAISECPSSATTRRTPGVAGRPGPKVFEGVPAAELRKVLWADFTLQMINLEVHYKVLEENGVDVSALKPRLASLLQQIDETIGWISNVQVTGDASRLWEDIIDFAAPNPILIADRRQYEPLQAKPEDFHPAANLCLLDITPKELDMAVPGVADRAEVVTICSYLLKFMFSFKNRSLTSVLERIAPNAAKDLIPMVPAITDPRRGGRLDPANLKVRQLTDEMMEGLAKAWVEWPFKPETHEMAIEMFDEAQGILRRTSDEALTPEAQKLFILLLLFSLMLRYLPPARYDFTHTAATFYVLVHFKTITSEPPIKTLRASPPFLDSRLLVRLPRCLRKILSSSCLA
ncbi:uncharacterized protein MYCFIDRAFT_179452 [Pseudocercospora fijiensis CIRAD86]|uniref:rRNA adenine N(6)-methyltransferase n=1 Tax=Pseudocercospora fijiensis (strain CIRAD86) TaxID=383855 RepID=M3AKJ8_PSEFD|nr:uncharacterized protein MYCFIDRAFT_179452 [Pseudocercospora fijiensis CIRAD86]EME77997.1 hypothetical protein MYCFIDRAFT_179452 [Pseudocercospora fijiensis CIRAD86]